MEYTFWYPSNNWLLGVFIVATLLTAWRIPRFYVALPTGVVALLLAWYAHETYLPVYVGSWLDAQRPYAIIFRDFPTEREKFILAYERVFKTDGEIAVENTYEEMKLIMMKTYVGHYITNAPASVLVSYIQGELSLLASLNNKETSTLCGNYMMTPLNTFGDVWRRVGSDIYVRSLNDIPLIISGAVDHPEPVSASDKVRAMQLFEQLIRSMESSGGLYDPPSCDTVYREYRLLAQMPPKDAVLLLKFILSPDHLESSIWGSYVRQLLPFQ